jgi:hypothetical protein
VKRAAVIASAVVLAFVGGAYALAQTGDSSTPNISGHFDWTVIATGVPFTTDSGQQYWVQWYFEGANGFQYWLGSNVNNPYRTPTTTTVVMREQLADIAGCEYQPEPCDLHGDYYATLYKVVDGVYTDDPLLDSNGAPYTFEQDLDR